MNIVLEKWFINPGRGLEFGSLDPRLIQEYWLACNFSFSWTWRICGATDWGKLLVWLRLYHRAGEKNLLLKVKILQNPKRRSLVWLRLYFTKNEVEEERERGWTLDINFRPLHTIHICTPPHTQAHTCEYTHMHRCEKLLTPKKAWKAV